MTFGEEWFKEKSATSSLKYARNITVKAQRMSRKDAGKYYNTKLFNYWVEMLDNTVSKKNRTMLLSALMFGNTKEYKNKILLNTTI